MPDFNLTKSAQAVDDSLALIDNANNKLIDTVVAGVGVPLNAAALLSNTQLTPTVGQTIYHTGNVGGVKFNSAKPTAGEDLLVISPNNSATKIESSFPGTTNAFHVGFANGNGAVGSISTSGASTSYNTSSDPRLKDFLPQPTDAEVDDYFTRLFNSAAVFTWKSDANKIKTWGFDAHKSIDNGLHMGLEGQGPRNMAIGEKYQDAVLDEEGNELEPAKYVTSAGVDQGKDIAALVFKIAQLEQRIKTLEGV